MSKDKIAEVLGKHWLEYYPSPFRTGREPDNEENWDEVYDSNDRRVVKCGDAYTAVLITTALNNLAAEMEE
ncbi:hypothetical protein LCGC14_2918120 [marine sediment metagenome]|uniref:Uncharacterized protein n=1 Tax=marine sediment metagenome TaxID=412755 RepID=A0A0F8YBI6_9ZZZZ